MHIEFKNKIREIVELNPTTYRSILDVKKENRYLRDFIYTETKNFSDILFSSKVFMVLNDIKEFPKCTVCGNELNHKIPCHPLNGFLRRTCSCKCAQLDKTTQQKIKESNLKKYGVERPQQLKSHRELLSQKIKMKSDNEKNKINEKRKSTCLKKYGVKNISMDKKIHQKACDSFKNRTIEEKLKTKEKRFNTNFEKYGNGNYFNSEKLKETWNNKTIEEKEKISKKRIETNLKNYGLKYSCLSKKAQENAVIGRRIKHFYEYILNDKYIEPLFTLEEYCNLEKETFLWKCKKCGTIFENPIRLHQSHLVRCLKCFPLNPQYSKYEKEIVEFIKSFYFGEIKENDKSIISPYELDIIIPEKKIAIEFDGLYWHSDEVLSNKNYHLMKTDKCNEQKYHLIHIFENEWIYKQDIVKSRLKNLLGIYEKTIYARKCEIKEINNDISIKFQNENHIQGSVNSSINIGLFFNDELVSLMTFSKSRMSKKYEYELVRFCNKLNYHVIGGASKLLKYFERNYKPKSIVSYADRRWSKGNLYEKVGFNLSHISKPNYWYVLRGTLNIESRIKYQKHKLKKIFKNFNDKLSEYENMKNNNYIQIYDCGNIVFEKIIKHT